MRPLALERGNMSDRPLCRLGAQSMDETEAEVRITAEIPMPYSVFESFEDNAAQE